MNAGTERKDPFVLEREGLRVSACPRTGKIMSIVAAGRSWLVAPDPADALHCTYGHAESERIFGIRHAWGADECFPTIAALEGIGTGDAPVARDHGEIWGRPCLYETTSEPGFTCRWEQGLRRTVSVGIGQRLHVEVQFPISWSATPGLSLESLYAFHALFAMETGSLLSLEKEGRTVFEAVFPEPGVKQARKFYAKADTGRLTHPDGTHVALRLGSSLEWFGVWWCNNGWGDGRSHRTVGLEPSTHGSDGPLVCAPLPERYLDPAGEPRATVSFSLEFGT